ncbi:uncharacterized protein FIBRA_09342 [Fibroporia radiculosa]|uniref:Uncharacterized protein n=1 Tax=Fibroporia radiculosa TaxID=599839 RepID=J7SCY4_9APHY|nr:uncharacterized protein FIBRA_09342 [Fibroporia radiculosa]CCM07023.1 predicted protein [Fibroporia radiculosa]
MSAANPIDVIDIVHTTPESKESENPHHVPSTTILVNPKGSSEHSNSKQDEEDNPGAEYLVMPTMLLNCHRIS